MASVKAGSASVKPFRESPGSPYTRRTPDAFSVATMTSATVAVIVWSFPFETAPGAWAAVLAGVVRGGQGEAGGADVLAAVPGGHSGMPLAGQRGQ